MYRVICPKGNWKNPIKVDQKGLDLVKEIATRLGLETNYDKQQQKFYLDLPKQGIETNLARSIAQTISDKVGTPLELFQEVVIDDILKATQGWPVERVAYVIATAWHESHLGKFMLELSSGNQYEGRKDLGNSKAGDGVRYKGRGYVQITGRVNYRRFGKILSRPIDLETYPEMAARPEVALEILLKGMQHGLFTGVGLDDYFTDTEADYVNARRIVNGLDKAEEIADTAKRVCDAIQRATKKAN